MVDSGFKVVLPLARPSPFVVADHHLLTTDVPEADHPEWLAATVYSTVGERVIIKNPSSTVTISIANPAVVTWTDHSIPVNSAIRLTTTVDDLPTGLLDKRVYYIRDVTANTFTLATKPGGSPLATTGTQSGIHTITATIHSIYEVLQVTNAGEHPTLFPLKWVRVSSTNRWKLFDGSTSSQTAQADSIDFTIRTDARADALVLLGVETATAQVIVTDTIDGIVYDKTISGIATDSITTPSAWFFDPIEFSTELDFTDIPKFFSNTDIQVKLLNTGNTVLCGNCTVGLLYNPGFSQKGYSLGIEDFSFKSTDDFGNFTIVERGFSREANVKVLVENTGLDRLHRVFAELRASPAAYIVTSAQGASMLFGFYERFGTLARFQTYSILSIELRGLI